MQSNRSGEYALWSIPANGDAAHMLLPINAADLRWAPDNSRLAFSYAADTGNGIGTVNRDGAFPRKYPFALLFIGPPAWSADGRTLYFSGSDTHGWRLWRLDLGPPVVARPISGYGWAAVQTHGTDLIAMKDGDHSLWLWGPTPKLITRDGPRALPVPELVPSAWRVYRDQIVFPDFSVHDRPTLVAIPITGGPATLFAEMPRLRDDAPFAIDPRDGTPVYSSVVSIDTNIELFHLDRR
jgi:hypothetical protein